MHLQTGTAAVGIGGRWATLRELCWVSCTDVSPNWCQPFTVELRLTDCPGLGSALRALALTCVFGRATCHQVQIRLALLEKRVGAWSAWWAYCCALLGKQFD